MNIGIDIVECERVKGLVNSKIFSEEELNYIHKKNDALPTIAGLFAAKEAYFKAVGTGIVKSELPKVVIGHYDNMKYFNRNNPYIALSINQTKTIAVAVCINF